MRFLLLLYGDEDAERSLPSDERKRIVDGHGGFSAMLRREGAYLASEALAASTEAATLRTDGMVTDGPFAEAREQLGSFYLLECADREQALRYARQVPRSPGLSVEVRPVLDS